MSHIVCDINSLIMARTTYVHLKDENISTFYQHSTFIHLFAPSLNSSPSPYALFLMEISFPFPNKSDHSSRRTASQIPVTYNTEFCSQMPTIPLASLFRYSFFHMLDTISSFNICQFLQAERYLQQIV